MSLASLQARLDRVESRLHSDAATVTLEDGTVVHVGRWAPVDAALRVLDGQSLYALTLDEAEVYARVPASGDEGSLVHNILRDVARARLEGEGRL